MAIAARSKRGRWQALPLRFGAVSLRIDARCLVMCAAGLAGLTALAAWAMTLGSFPVPFTEVARATLFGGDDQYAFIVRELRLPRVLSAILVGALLATAGAVFQGVVRNPLVSPDIIGVDAGASLAAVWWIVTGRDSTLLPVAAFAGAAAAAALVAAAAAAVRERGSPLPHAAAAVRVAPVPPPQRRHP